jgi:predicted dehydrogenase
MTYKALVVGLGQIGMGYDIDADPKARIATLARAFSEHPGYQFMGGVDFDPARRELFQAHYALPAFENIETAIKKTAPDVVAIAVPTEAHYQVFSQLMQLGTLKAILCEKPLSYDLAEATEMVSLASESGVMLFTNYMRRCDSAVIEVRRRITSKEIAGPIKGICWYSKGLFNNGSHFLNLFQYWLGGVLDFQIIDSGRLWEGHDPEPDVKIEFESGEIYFHAAPEEHFSHYSVELIAANGRLRYERGSMLWQSSVPDSNNSGYVVLNSNAEVIKSDAPRLQWAVVDQMARHLAGENTSICTGLQGLSTVQVLTQIKKEL